MNGTEFRPARIEVPAGTAVVLEFKRTTDETCAKEIVVPSLGIRKALPLNQVTEVALPAGPAREIPFVCGMNMLKGTVVMGSK